MILFRYEDETVKRKIEQRVAESSDILGAEVTLIFDYGNAGVCEAIMIIQELNLEDLVSAILNISAGGKNAYMPGYGTIQHLQFVVDQDVVHIQTRPKKKFPHNDASAPIAEFLVDFYEAYRRHVKDILHFCSEDEDMAIFY